MKRSPLLLLVACAFVLAALGCGHLDLKPESDPNRVVTGTVNVRMDLLPPPDSEVVVRVIEPPDVTSASTTASRDLVIGERGAREQPERVVAEQIIRAPAAMPVPFRIEYHATEAMLRRGLNIEARISWGRRIRFRTLEAQAITLTNADQPQTLRVEAVQ